MGKTSREKGKRGERELARKLREYGYDARRGQQYCGRTGVADVTGLKGIHIEVKRTERFRLYDALDQARRDARRDELPAVFHRANECDWVVCMRLSDWIEIYREWEAGNETNGKEQDNE
jgi:hypothetical protein